MRSVLILGILQGKNQQKARMGNERERVKSGLNLVPLARGAGRMELPKDRELVEGAVWEEGTGFSAS